MPARTLLFGADGTPAVVDVGPEDRIRMLLVEVFGLCISYKGDQPAPLAPSEVAKVIVDILGVEPLETRYGIQIEVRRRAHAAGSNPS